MKIKYVLESLSSGVEPKERAAELEWTEEQLLGAFDETGFKQIEFDEPKVMKGFC